MEPFLPLARIEPGTARSVGQRLTHCATGAPVLRDLAPSLYYCCNIDSLFFYFQLVVDWLESCAERDFETFSENIKFFSDRAVG